MSKIVRYERPKNSFKIFRFSPNFLLSSIIKTMNDKRETMREDEKNALIQRLNSSSQYLQSNDMKVVDIDRGFARVEMIIDEHILNIHGFVHGGACSRSPTPSPARRAFATGRDSVTLTGSINYIKPGKGGKLIGVATEISAGRTTGVYEVFIYNDEQVLLCRATFTMFFLDGGALPRPKQKRIWRKHLISLFVPNRKS